MRLHTSPGEYDVIVSDFDLNRKKIQRQKRLAKRSEWASNVAFTSTDSRFNIQENDGGPTPMSYLVQNYSISGSLKHKKGLMGGPFGSSAKVT